MNTPSTPDAPPVLVWDAPVRVFHWLLAASFVGAYITAESERWRLVHVTLGYTVGALVVFRLLWGLVGTRHARFSAFVRGPAAVAAYLRSLPGGGGEHPVGHNPAGGWAIVGLLTLAALSLGKQTLGLCPTVAGSMLAYGRDGLRFAASTERLDLMADYGGSPLSMNSGPLRIAYPGTIIAPDLSIALGTGDQAIRFSARASWGFSERLIKSCLLISSASVTASDEAFSCNAQVVSCVSR